MPGPEILEAANRLQKLGFLDEQGDRPGAAGGARLILALREQPQLTHFDPDWVGYWHVVDGRGRVQRLDRTTPLPLDVRFSWGPIRIIDRLAVANAFLSFGGQLVAEPLDAGTTIAIFTSPAPIARWTGHSQAPDPLAERIGAFLARLMVPVDFVPGFESRLAAARPLAIYAAMLVAWHAELTGSAFMWDAEPGGNAFIDRELERIRTEDPEAANDGLELVAALTPGG
jgi:hypothetical protein